MDLQREVLYRSPQLETSRTTCIPSHLFRRPTSSMLGRDPLRGPPLPMYGKHAGNGSDKARSQNCAGRDREIGMRSPRITNARLVPSQFRVQQCLLIRGTPSIRLSPAGKAFYQACDVCLGPQKRMAGPPRESCSMVREVRYWNIKRYNPICFR